MDGGMHDPNNQNLRVVNPVKQVKMSIEAGKSLKRDRIRFLCSDRGSRHVRKSMCAFLDYLELSVLEDELHLCVTLTAR